MRVFEKEAAFMESLSLFIAVLALIVASAAYYRSGSKKPIRALERAMDEKIQRLSAMTQRVADNVAATVKAAYERSIRMISDLQSRVAALREEAVEEIREDLGVIARKLDRLAERAARELKELKNEIDSNLIDAEIGLQVTVDDAKAHLKAIEAKQELVLVRMAVLRNDLIEAESRVASVLKHLEEAQSLALGHHEQIAALQKQAQELLVAVRTKASTMRASIDTLIGRSNRLLNEMSGREAEARSAA
jgi:DNA anti-recombination protein RmuC